jgi:pyruvate-formate lyase-activating enzyme
MQQTYQLQRRHWQQKLFANESLTGNGFATFDSALLRHRGAHPVCRRTFRAETRDAANISIDLRTAAFAAGLGNGQRVDVLPFHQMGRFKWQKLGMPYTLEQTTAPSADLIERTIAIFRNEGLNAV